MPKRPHTLTAEPIRRYAVHLSEEERAGNTVRKYLHDLEALREYLHGRPLSKTLLLNWKSWLTSQYAPATVNSMLAVAHGFFAFLGWRELGIKLLKIQRSPFCDEERELTRTEYTRLVRAAEQEDNLRLSLLLQTICATGIRVSELRFITAETVRSGRAEVHNKGKHRLVFHPDKLRGLLKNIPRQKKSPPERYS